MGDGQFGHADIGTDLEGFFYGEGPAGVWFRIINGAAGDLPGPAVEVDRVAECHFFVFEQGKQGSEFESGPRLGGADGVVHVLPISTVGLLAQVGYGLDLTRCHLHDDAGAVLGLVFLEFPEQGVLGDILDIDVDGGDDIPAVDGLYLIPLYRDVGTSGDIPDQPAAGLAFEEGIVGAFQPYVLGIRSCKANGTIGQQAEGVQSFI